MWDAIHRNRRRSFLVVGIMGAFLVALGAAVGFYFTNSYEGMVGGALIALFIWFVQWLIMRSRGDDILLGMANARQIEKKDHPQLFNVVEEMTIASGLPQMPRVFIVDDPAPNAFAVGRDPKKASVAVTIGLLRLLDRDELQGVVAHEIGHIKNRDVALMTTVGIMLGAIVLLADLGRRALWYGGGGMRRSRDDSGGGAQAIILVVALVLMVLAPLLAQLLYFWLSRRREFLADASGAMFTRWPEGLASALEKLGGVKKAQVDQSRVTAPMYIVRPLREGERRSLTSAFSTHPPLLKRIEILRGMGGGAGIQSYDEAYRNVLGRRGHVVGRRDLEAAAAVPVQRPAFASEPTTPTARLREASDAYLAGAHYERKGCPGCGAILKIPPQLEGDIVVCPRCHTKL